jgi:hypothetical protein
VLLDPRTLTDAEADLAAAAAGLRCARCRERRRRAAHARHGRPTSTTQDGAGSAPCTGVDTDRARGARARPCRSSWATRRWACPGRRLSVVDVPGTSASSGRWCGRDRRRPRSTSSWPPTTA